MEHATGASSSIVSNDSCGLGRASRFAVHEGPQYSLFACYAFTINYILGVGSLGMPYAAQEAGYAAGLLLIVVVSLLSFVTVMMVARTALRAEMLVLRPCVNNPIGKWCYVKCIATVGEPLLKDEEALCGACAANCRMPPQAYEVVQLCDIFLGKAGRLSYQLALVLLMYAGLLAYVLVFVSTLTSVFLLSSDLSLLICAAVMIPFSMLNVTEMVPLQVTLSIVNIISLLVMGGIGFATSAADPWKKGEQLQAVNVNGLAVAFSTALFSQLFQHSVPGLINPLTRAHRTRIPSIFGMALVTTAVLYVYLSMGCVLTFGRSLEENVNVNFAKFDWGANPPWIATATSRACAFYPALATVAVFPLIVITLGNSLRVVAPLSKECVAQNPRKVLVLFRLLAALPPIAIAVVLKSLSMVFKISALGGIWVAFVTPALLQMYSKRAIYARFDRLIRTSSRNSDLGPPFLGSIGGADMPSLVVGDESLDSCPTSPDNLSRQASPSAATVFQENAAKRTPLFPRFNQQTWVYLVLGSAALAFVVTIEGIVQDLFFHT